jgi:hypothetical protein
LFLFAFAGYPPACWSETEIPPTGAAGSFLKFFFEKIYVHSGDWRGEKTNYGFAKLSSASDLRIYWGITLWISSVSLFSNLFKPRKATVEALMVFWGIGAKNAEAPSMSLKTFP